MLEYYLPDCTLLREYYVLNKNLVPNWFGHFVMAALMYIVPPLVAEKILVSGYVILLPISIRYALYAIRPETVFLAFLAFPFIYKVHIQTTRGGIRTDLHLTTTGLTQLYRRKDWKL